MHGIPNRRKLTDGDLLSVDCGAQVDGYHGDSAITVAVGDTDEAARRLVDTTVQALAAGIAAARPGNRIGDISHAVQTVRPRRQLRAARLARWPRHRHRHKRRPAGTQPHRGLRLHEGLVIAIEPMLIDDADNRCRTGPDGWTVLTANGKRAAHAEHTIAVTVDGPVVLTAE